MIIFSAVKLKELFKKERNYPWKKPQACPCCRSCTVWGHGFAEAIFDGFDRPLLLKLYRCPDCGCVIRLRPMNRWLPGISRTRQCHWFRALKTRIKAYLTETWVEGVVAGFDYLLQLGQTPVSRSI
jgi:hypothetical protein